MRNSRPRHCRLEQVCLYELDLLPFSCEKGNLLHKRGHLQQLVFCILGTFGLDWQGMQASNWADIKIIDTYSFHSKYPVCRYSLLIGYSFLCNAWTPPVREVNKLKIKATSILYETGISSKAHSIKE